MHAFGGLGQILLEFAESLDHNEVLSSTTCQQPNRPHLPTSTMPICMRHSGGLCINGCLALQAVTSVIPGI